MPGDNGNSVVLVTGANGFLGTQVIRRLPPSVGEIVVLVRAADDEQAARRLARAWWDWPELAATIGHRVRIVRGDVAAPGLGLDVATYAGLVRRLTHVIHTAADLRLDAPLDEMRRCNVQGAANVLALAEAAHADHGLLRFAHVSTAYVAGRRRGAIAEASLSDEAGFSNSYEQSKFEAERLVRAAAARLPVSVFRPGMIVGDSRTGAIKTFNTLYFPLRLYLGGKLRLVPASSGLRVNMVPVDYVAGAIADLTFAPEAAGLTFHLTAPPESLPTAKELIEFVRTWARERLEVSLPRPVFLPMPAWLLEGSARAANETGKPRGTGLLARLRELAPYFGERRQFGCDNATRLYPFRLDWRRFLPPVMEYAAHHGFLHRSERTVHEQVLFRLQSHSRPVRYYDIVDGEAVSRSAESVRRDVLAAVAALRSLGVVAGDRVGIVGLNSSRYLTLDVAVGLVGAVSVPLYYTSPPAELDRILAASGVRLLCIGAPRVLARLNEMGTEATVVSFCREPVPAGLSRPVLTWADFLARSGAAGDGAGRTADPMAPVAPDDLATLRYSSGTTGAPKGVTFNHRHLRWMAECMATLPPWRARNRRATWLSFLPMNHVVEGILGTYSPYYVPAPVDIYFLEDFRGLQQALPLVRPSIFFSVPRLYQKVWQGISASALGRAYLRGPAALRAVLRPFLRRALLSRAGLDRCTQLIAGSAPSAEALLRDFRDLGIEVHNAYGLTEAPLITINRLGRNRLDTVGEPLPQTEVRIADEGGGSGEVLVRGPQVTAGYYGTEAASLVGDGWLHTGDLGRLTADGSLVLEGRRKEIIITAYGKNIHPGKIEAMLQDVPGIAQALVVGEGKPYCAALLWPEGKAAPDCAALDAAVARLNQSLSHPEQLKRWAVLPNDLSPESGELTANLKLKRQIVAAKHAAAVAALYGESDSPDGVLHFGQLPVGAGSPRPSPSVDQGHPGSQRRSHLSRITYHLLPVFRTLALRRLFAVTARGFARPLPPLPWRHDRLLEQYARFSAAAAREAMAQGEEAEVIWRRLRSEALAASGGLRRLLRPHSAAEAMAAARSLYRCIGIDFACGATGDIEVAACYFTGHYDAAVCRFMAALDEGILAGLHGEGSLRWSERLTEGCPRCRAQFVAGAACGAARFATEV